jgi:hypothetical protein
MLLTFCLSCSSYKKGNMSEVTFIEKPPQTVEVTPEKPAVTGTSAYDDVADIIWQLCEIRIGYGKTELDREAMSQNGMGDMFILQLTEEGVNGKAAPNRYYTTYELRHNHNIRLRTIVSTLMAANINIGGLMETEYYWYLQHTNQWEIVNGELELYAYPSQNEEIVLRYTRQ